MFSGGSISRYWREPTWPGEILMRRFGLRAGTWVLAGAMIAAATPAYAVFATRSHVTSLSNGGRQPPTSKLARQHPLLDHGVLTHSKLTTMQARQTASFEVEVVGVGRGPGRMSRIVSVQGICSNGLSCTPKSDTRQEVAGRDRSAEWHWNVTARSPGEARILLVATTSYRRGSRIVLDRVSDVVRVRIQATPLYYLERDVDADGMVVLLALAGLVAAGAVAAAVVGLRKAGRGRVVTPSLSADTSHALTEPLRIGAGPLPGTRPIRPPGSWSALLWLAPVDIAAGGLVTVLVNAATTKSPAFAIVAGAVVTGALPLYVLPLIIAYLRGAPDRASVAVINVLLGWTYLGWVAALALAVRDRQPGSSAGRRPSGSLAARVPLQAWQPQNGGPSGKEQDGHGRNRSAHARTW
jgi:hypothetical protein